MVAGIARVAMGAGGAGVASVASVAMGAGGAGVARVAMGAGGAGVARVAGDPCAALANKITATIICQNRKIIEVRSFFYFNYF